tara:strand:- start:593 stop:982 length:390 start_codon:yes stop_codon:yes gene_type:complete
MSALVVIPCAYPPSVNRIWRARGGKNGGKPSFYLDARYASWRRGFDASVMAMVPRPKVLGRFDVSITLSDAKRRSNSDADNRIKALLDALQRCQIIENDSLAESVTVRWGKAPEGCLIVIYPRIQEDTQ